MGDSSLKPLFKRLKISHTPYSSHATINIKVHQRRDCEIELWARASSELGRQKEGEYSLQFLPSSVHWLQKVLWVTKVEKLHLCRLQEKVAPEDALQGVINMLPFPKAPERLELHPRPLR